MTPKSILKRALALLEGEVEWIQGSYITVDTPDGFQSFGGGSAVPSTILVAGKEIPFATASKSACAIGLVELAFKEKGFEPKVGDYLGTDEMKAVRQYLDAAILENMELTMRTFENLSEKELSWYQEDYKYYLDDMAWEAENHPETAREPASLREYVNQRLKEDQDVYDSVEEWNDSGDRTVEDVIAVFKRAAELAPHRVIGSPAASRPVGPVMSALTA